MFVTYHDYAYKVIRVSVTPHGIPTITLKPYIISTKKVGPREVCILNNGNKVIVTPFIFANQNKNKTRSNIVVFGSMGITPCTMTSITTIHKKIHPKFK